MSNVDKAKAEAERIADEMRNGADRIRQNVEGAFNPSTGANYSYAKLTQQLRIAQLGALPLQAFSLYTEADRLGIIFFLLPFSFICLAAYLIFMRWNKHVDGRLDVQNVMNSRNTQTKIHHAIQAFGPFLLALLIHALAPTFPSSISSLIFHLADYLLIASTFACLALDSFEGIKGKIQ